MLVRSALVFVLATAGCATSRPDAVPPASSETAETPAAETPAAEVPAAGTVRISLGEAVTVADVPVRFDAVTEDSRCPPDVNCVWAGRAHVRLVVGGEPVDLSVPGYGPNDTVPETITRGGLTVRVLSMTPKAPDTPSAGGPEPLWVELDVTRA